MISFSSFLIALVATECLLYKLNIEKTKEAVKTIPTMLITNKSNAPRTISQLRIDIPTPMLANGGIKATAIATQVSFR